MRIFECIRLHTILPVLCKPRFLRSGHSYLHWSSLSNHYTDYPLPLQSSLFEDLPRASFAPQFREKILRTFSQNMLTKSIYDTRFREPHCPSQQNLMGSQTFYFTCSFTGDEVSFYTMADTVVSTVGVGSGNQISHIWRAFWPLEETCRHVSRPLWVLRWNVDLCAYSDNAKIYILGDAV